MGDLISREALINTLNDEESEYEVIIDIPKNATTKDIIDITLTEYRKIMFEAIDNQPTAYDVDEVVKNIKMLRHPYTTFPEGYGDLNAYDFYINKAITIVKEGAVKDE